MLNHNTPGRGLSAGKLNVFQRTMLEWNDIHAYNAVHVVGIPVALELDKLRIAVNRTVERRGLTALSLDRRRGTYSYSGGPAQCGIQVVQDEANPQSTLFGEIERQLNVAFVPAERFSPFRFFVAAETGCFSLGLTYFHAVADAESFVLLMKEIVESYLDRNGPPSAPPADLYPPCYDNLLRHQPGLLARKVSAIPALVRDMRLSCRPPYRNGGATTNGFTFCSLGSDQAGRLRAAAKLWGVTLNDLFLGLLMKSLAVPAADRILARKRKNISVGCIVNTRKDLALPGAATFGLFLGSFIVTHEVPERCTLRELVTDIHR